MVEEASNAELEGLRTIIRRRSEEARIVRRAELVLDALVGGSIRGTASHFNSDRKTVRRWVGRWLSNPSS
jgi:transposase